MRRTTDGDGWAMGGRRVGEEWAMSGRRVGDEGDGEGRGDGRHVIKRRRKEKKKRREEHPMTLKFLRDLRNLDFRGTIG